MITIHCDGAYSSSRNMGGWAFVVLDNGNKVFSSFYPVSNTTNNRMEIQAAIEACEWCHANNVTSVTIYSDSMYVVGTMTLNWKRKKNHDLWAILDNLKKDLSIEWKHVKGHAGNKYNELCDALAVMATHIVE